MPNNTEEEVLDVIIEVELPDDDDDDDDDDDRGGETQNGKPGDGLMKLRTKTMTSLK